MPQTQELVTIGIPTYGRARRVERAVRSALAQTHRNIEVIVSDDASPDDTAAVLRRIARQDDRVRPHFQANNLGHARNFRFVFERAAGRYFMWLSDDDWIEPEYVEHCLRALNADPELVLVCGRARYPDSSGFELERPTVLRQRRAATRVCRYFSTVNLNGALYGLARTDDLARVPFEEIPGGDWLLVAGLAAIGQVTTLDETHINRSAHGMSSDAAAFVTSQFGLRGLLARHHHLSIAREVAVRVIGGRGAFPALGSFPTRVAVAAYSASMVTARFTLLGILRRLLERLRLIGVARALIAPLRAARHR